jgi:hypothetical protein
VFAKREKKMMEKKNEPLGFPLLYNSAHSKALPKPKKTRAPACLTLPVAANTRLRPMWMYGILGAKKEVGEKGWRDGKKRRKEK